jgi:hypothetical protein
MKHTLLIIVFILPLWVAGQQRLSFSGQITDSKTGKTIEGASVLVEKKQTGTIADSNGNFFLHLVSNQYKVTFSATGYAEQQITFDLIENTNIEVKLKPQQKESRRGNQKTIISQIIRLDKNE